MNTITINGNTITSSGSISISNGKITVNGVDVTPDAKVINISVVGNVEKLQADCCQTITVTGDVGNIVTQSGDVEVSWDIKWSIQTMSGDVDCWNVAGNISTMSGNVKNKK